MKFVEVNVKFVNVNVEVNVKFVNVNVEVYVCNCAQVNVNV